MRDAEEERAGSAPVVAVVCNRKERQTTLGRRELEVRLYPELLAMENRDVPRRDT